jgi:hypothetical protein
MLADAAVAALHRQCSMTQRDFAALVARIVLMAGA